MNFLLNLSLALCLYFLAGTITALTLHHSDKVTLNDYIAAHKTHMPLELKNKTASIKFSNL